MPNDYFEHDTTARITDPTTPSSDAESAPPSIEVESKSSATTPDSSPPWTPPPPRAKPKPSTFIPDLERAAIDAIKVLTEVMAARHDGDDHKPSRALRAATAVLANHTRLKCARQTEEPDYSPVLPAIPPYTGDPPRDEVGGEDGRIILPLDTEETLLVMAYLPHIDPQFFRPVHMADYWRHQVRTQRYWRARYHHGANKALLPSDPPRGEINLRLGTRDDPVFPDTHPGSRPDLHPPDPAPPSSA